MSFSENIKKYRTRKNLTQEQLANLVGVSAQAVSKWECNDSYPDGSLYVAIANALEVSLDALFGRCEVYMDDLSSRIIRAVNNTPEENRFRLARQLGWQIEKGLFFCNSVLSIDEEYDESEIDDPLHSYVLNDHGFTAIAHDSQFFSVFEEPVDGWASIIGDAEEMRLIFECLSHRATMTALLWLYHQSWNYLFEAELVGAILKLDDDELTTAIANLCRLGVIVKKEIDINGEPRVLYYACQKHIIIAILLFAHELNHSYGYNLQIHPKDRIYLK